MKNDLENLELGHPVLLLRKEDGIILPAIVIGEIRELNSPISWKLMVGKKGDNRKIIDTSKLSDNFKIYSNIYSLREDLFKTIVESVTQKVKTAIGNLQDWYQDEIPLEVLSKAMVQKQTNKTKEIGEDTNKSFEELTGINKNSLTIKNEEKKSKKKSKKKEVGETSKSIESTTEPEFTTISNEQEPGQDNLIANKVRIKIIDPENPNKIKYINPEELENNQIEF